MTFHEPNNQDRAQWAKKALDAFPAKEKGQHLQNVGDLIGDLLHLARLCGMQDADTFLAGIAARFNEEELEDSI